MPRAGSTGGRGGLGQGLRVAGEMRAVGQEPSVLLSLAWGADSAASHSQGSLRPAHPERGCHCDCPGCGRPRYCWGARGDPSFSSGSGLSPAAALLFQCPLGLAAAHGLTVTSAPLSVRLCISTKPRVRAVDAARNVPLLFRF